MYAFRPRYLQVLFAVNFERLFLWLRLPKNRIFGTQNPVADTFARARGRTVCDFFHAHFDSQFNGQMKLAKKKEEKVENLNNHSKRRLVEGWAYKSQKPRQFWKQKAITRCGAKAPRSRLENMRIAAGTRIQSD